MKTQRSFVAATILVLALSAPAGAVDLYTAALSSGDGNCLVCGAMDVSGIADYRIDISIQKADGSGDIGGGYCDGGNGGVAWCEIEANVCTPAQTAWCRITVKNKRHVRGAILKVVNAAGETVAVTPAQ